MDANIVFDMIYHLDHYRVVLPSNYSGTWETTINSHYRLTFTQSSRILHHHLHTLLKHPNTFSYEN